MYNLSCTKGVFIFMAEAKKTTKNPVEKKSSAKAAEAVKVQAAALKAQAGKQTGGFLDFVRKQGVVGLAVGLAIGTAAGAAVKTIVEQLISPLVGLMTQGVKLDSLKWVLIDANPVRGREEVAIGWGLILSALITLLATALVVYLFVHFARLDQLDKKKD
jgi:large conductance mechanosensitive channel